jgi:hypothetical protein
MLICLGFISSSILVSSALAWAWAWNRRWLGYVISTIAVRAAVSALPTLLLVPLVLKGAATRTILVASAVAAIFAVPLSFYCALYAKCEILHDCG